MFRNVIGGVTTGLIVVAALTFVLNVLALVLPVYMLQVYDRVLPSSSLATLLYLTLIAVAALAVLGVVEGVRQIVVQRVGARLEVDVGERLLATTFAGDADGPAAAIALRELAQARTFLASQVFSALLDAPFAPLFLLMVFVIHPLLGLLVLGGIVVLLTLTLMNQAALKFPQRTSAEAMFASLQLVGACTQNCEVIRAMGMSRNAIEAWGRKTAGAINAQDRATCANSVFAGTSRFVRLGVQVGILALGAYLTINQQITAGMIFATSLIAARALAPIDNLIAGWKGLLQAITSFDKIGRLLASFASLPQRTKLLRASGHLAFEKVVYVPPGATEPTIKGITVAVNAGESVCILGPSGAGKSTFARLAAGAIHPSRGAVRLDGSAIENWDASERGRFVGYVPQDIELLPATVAQNIARLDMSATAEEISAAAELAGVAELVKRLPAGYDTPIGPGGLPLSGGQRQRIALARALFRVPRLVVLDEPNAHLDSEGENALNASIAALKQSGTTVIVVSQRSGVLQSVDRILFMRDGQIAAAQTRDEALGRLRPAPREGGLAQAAAGA